MTTEKNNYEIITEYLIANEAQLTNYARKLAANNSTNAKDLFQETAYRALLNIDKYRGYGYPGAWLYTIMRNIYLNDQNCACNKQQIYTEIADFQIADTALMPDEEYSVREIIAAIEQFKHENDKLLMTRWIQGYTYAEIAEELDMKIGTVKSSLFRLIHYLRVLLR